MELKKMAEAITIQKLIDASMDSDSLETLVNGDENTTVITRTGETYPSAKKAITNLFANGGLSATRFNSEQDLITNGAELADGTYAVVTEDLNNKNGFYLKKDGVWVLSAFNPLSQTQKFLAEKTLGDRQLTSQKVTMVAQKENGQYKTDGTFEANANLVTSEPIAVKENDCYVLTDLLIDNTIVHSFTLFDADDNFVAVIANYSFSNGRHTTTEQQKFSLKAGLYFDESNLYTSGVIVPDDGFIRVTYASVGTNNGISTENSAPSLFKVSYETLIKTIAVQAPCNVLIKFKDVLQSVKIDKTIASNGALSLPEPTAIGEHLRYQSGYSFISERIKIVAGQYIHAHYANFYSTQGIIFEDENGDYLGRQDIINEHTVGFNNALKTSVALNIKSNFTGYFRIAKTRDASIPFMVGITDYSINYQRNYLNRDTNTLIFNPNLGTANNDDSRRAFNSITIGERLGNPDLSKIYTQSIPYVLKKGEVLEYSLDASVSPLFAILFTCDKPISISIDNYNDALPLVANEIVSVESMRQWALAKKPDLPLFYNKGRSGTVAYCNDDTDAVVIFLRPNKFSGLYNSQNLNQGYTINATSKEEYKAKRNKHLAERFKTISGIAVQYGAFDANQTTSTYPSVLLFKGEVLNYLTTGTIQARGVSLQTMNTTDRAYSDIGSNYSNFYDAATKQSLNTLPIRHTNPSSYAINQIYAHENCVVYAGLNYLTPDFIGNLDADKIIADGFFEPRIVDIKTAKIGDNLIPYQALGLETYYPTNQNKTVSVYNFGGGDTLLSFLAKDTSIEASFWSEDSNHTMYVGDIKAKRENESFSFETLRPVFNEQQPDGSYLYDVAEPMLSKIGYTAKADSVVAVTSRIADRDMTKMFVDGSQLALQMYAEDANLYKIDNYKHSIETISNTKCDALYGITDKTFIEIADTRNVVFNFCTAVSHSIPRDFYSILQIKKGDDVIAVVNALTANQGQSTVNSLRKNVNIEFLNNKYEKVSLKFADAIETDEMVLKSYYDTDKNHIKDTTAIDLWYKMRHADPYPIGGVVPNYIFADATKPQNQLARCSTYSFPVKQQRGDKFYSLSSIKSKKKRENYAMVSDNELHILMQADWELNGNINWQSASLANFEIRNPKIKGYLPGAVKLPVKSVKVETNAARIVTWMRGVFDGSIDAKATYKDYVNLDSLLDYCLHAEIVGNVDGVRNNFMIGTHDGKLWDFYAYDLDQSWGSFNNEPRSHSMLATNDTFFAKILSVFADESKARYAKLRRSNVVSAKRIQDKMLDLNSYMSVRSKELDMRYWGAPYELNKLASVMQWSFIRVRYLDALYGYLEPNAGLVHQSVRIGATIKAGATRVTTRTVSDVKAGDNLYAETGNDIFGLTLTASCTVDGTIEVVQSNKTDADIKTENTYLRVYKI